MASNLFGVKQKLIFGLSTVSQPIVRVQIAVWHEMASQPQNVHNERLTTISFTVVAFHLYICYHSKLDYLNNCCCLGSTASTGAWAG